MQWLKGRTKNERTGARQAEGGRKAGREEANEAAAGSRVKVVETDGERGKDGTHITP